MESAMPRRNPPRLGIFWRYSFGKLSPVRGRIVRAVHSGIFFRPESPRAIGLVPLGKTPSGIRDSVPAGLDPAICHKGQWRVFLWGLNARDGLPANNQPHLYIMGIK